MKTVGSILHKSIAFLQEKRPEDGRRCAEELLAEVLGCKRLDLYLNFDRPLEEEELVSLRTLLQRARRGEPLQYILGEVEFYGCSISVTPSVLIPRPETELLVDAIVKELRMSASLEGCRLWDLCTGSGCIGISLKKTFPELDVSIIDLSSEALSLAKENAKKNEVEVTPIQGDLFSGCKEGCDFLVCNPPYVSESEFFHLHKGVKEWEPKLALVGGADGLDFYRRLSCEAVDRLHPSGRLFLEIGYSQGEAVADLFSRAPWRGFCLLKDLAGHPRFIFLERE